MITGPESSVTVSLVQLSGKNRQSKLTSKFQILKVEKIPMTQQVQEVSGSSKVEIKAIDVDVEDLDELQDQ